jgi:hypothetical protein
LFKQIYALFSKQGIRSVVLAKLIPFLRFKGERVYLKIWKEKSSNPIKFIPFLSWKLYINLFNYMINKICVLLALCLLATSIKINHVEDHEAVAGGWNPINVKKLTTQEKNVDEFIRKSNLGYKDGILLKGEE